MLVEFLILVMLKEPQKGWRHVPPIAVYKVIWGLDDFTSPDILAGVDQAVSEELM